jgi:hypothetical protein
MALLCFFLTILASPFKSKIPLEAENAALRHQLVVLRRKVRGRVRLTNNDRLSFGQLYGSSRSLPPQLCWSELEVTQIRRFLPVPARDRQYHARENQLMCTRLRR